MDDQPVGSACTESYIKLKKNRYNNQSQLIRRTIPAPEKAESRSLSKVIVSLDSERANSPNIYAKICIQKVHRELRVTDNLWKWHQIKVLQRRSVGVSLNLQARRELGGK